MLDNKYVCVIGSKGGLIPLSTSNRRCGCTGFEYGMTWEKEYALEEWYVIPFVIVFPVEIYVISTELRPNTTFFGKPMWVIWYTDNKFATREGT